MKCWIGVEIPDMPEEARIRTLIEETLEAGLKYEHITEEVEISVTITTPEEVRALNCRFRAVDQTTDVLSFPLVEFEKDDDRNEVLKESERNPDTEAVPIGDIVINYEQAVTQAEAYGHSMERELAFLTIHSLLHLLGYDHMKPEEEADMRSRQRDVLASLHLTR